VGSWQLAIGNLQLENRQLANATTLFLFLIIKYNW
jgi:hypothetical protein